MAWSDTLAFKYECMYLSICPTICIHTCGRALHSMQAVMRSWKQYYTVLAGPLLNFYREKKDFQQVRSSYTQMDGTLFYTHVMPMKTMGKPHYKTADHPHIDTTYLSVVTYIIIVAIVKL